MTRLVVNDLFAGYGPVRVLHGVSLTVEPGEVTVLLGANGAGKTTTLRAISGLIERSGVVQFGDAQLGSLRGDAISRLGVAHVPEGRGTFTELTVDENLRLGGCTRPAKEVRRDLDRWYGFFPRLRERQEQVAGTLSGGEQQMLAIARALMLQPRLILLDEPSMGLAPTITQDVFSVLKQINAELGTGILIVEQNAHLAMEFADRVYLLEAGRVVLEGSADDLRDENAIRRAYLGY